MRIIPSNKALYLCICISASLSPVERLSGSELQNDPSWFSANRIQIHTAIGPSRRGGLKTLEINDLVEELGVGVYTRHVKSDWRDPFWYGLVTPSTRQKTGLITNRQLFRAAIEEASEKGIRVGAYYWEAGGWLRGNLPSEASGFVSHRNDNATEVAGLAVDLLCKDRNGQLIPERAGKKIRGWHADLSSPEFREIVLSDLIEIVEFGFSTLFFDERHFPNANQSPCFGSVLEEKYRLVYAVKQDVKHWSDEEITRYVQFQAAAMAATFDYWKTALQNRGFFPVFVISGTYLANLILPHMSFDLARVADSVKMEYQHGLRKSLGGAVAQASGLPLADADIRKYLAWILARDLSDGLPPYVWRQTFQSNEELILAASEIIFHGAVAGIHVADRLFGQRGTVPRRSPKDFDHYLDTPLSVLRQGISEVKQIADLFALSKPYAEIGVLVDEHSLTSLDSVSDRWALVAQPLQMTVQKLYELGLPFRIITEEHLLDSELDLEYVLPIGAVSEEVSDRLESLTSQGLVLLSLDGIRAVQFSDLNAISLDELASEQRSTLPFRYRLIQNGKHTYLRATFQKADDGKMLIGLICSIHSDCMAEDDGEHAYVSLQNKPDSAQLVPDGKFLDVKQLDNGEWMLPIRSFKSSQLLVLRY